MSNIDNQKLMDYASGKLSPEDQHEVEKWMLENPFDADAIEGLQNAGGEKNIHATVEQLNKQLHKYLQQKKHKRRKKLDSSNIWTYVAVLFILALAVLVYLIIERLG